MKIQQLINNELVLGDGPSEKIINPFNSEIIIEIPQSSNEQVELAVQSAKSAFSAWSRTTPADRSAMLLKVADMIEQKAEEIARIESLNCGKPYHLVLNDEIPGEHFKCTAKMSISTASVLGCYNVAHTCSFVYEKDIVQQNAVWNSIKNTIVEKDDTPETEALKKKNWMLGEGTKIVKPNIYNFQLDTVGVFTNLQIIRKALDILIGMFKKYMEKNDYIITNPNTIIENGYDIQIEDDYTAGYILQHILYQHFYENEKILSFVGFKKFHPHDSYSIIRLAFNGADSNEETARSLIKRSSEIIVKYLQDLDSKFI